MSENMTRKSDEEVLREYYAEMEQPICMPFQVLVRWVKKIREHEPRINSGVHLIDYCGICDEDDDMDSFYGPDYPW
jgi:hypothetical protein